MAEMSSASSRALLRHALATVTYRGGKALRDAPGSFATFRIGDPPRTPAEILAHIGDLFEWALSIAKGTQAWKGSQALEWPAEVARFFEAVGRFDAFLASDAAASLPENEISRLFQGPVADALTHIGQLAMLRRLAGSPIRGEDYHMADIVIGRVGAEQTPPRREF